MGKMHRFAAISCTHAPITHKGYWEWVLGILQDFKPDTFVHLGDLYEGKPAKKFAKWQDEVWSVVAEHKAVASQLEQINEIGVGKKVWLWGNHDDNMFGEQPDRIADDMKEVVHYEYNQNVSAQLKDWKVIKYDHRARFNLGPVTFQHGCNIDEKAERNQGVLYGCPYGLYIQGHTHRPCPVVQAELTTKYPLPYWYANPGCGCDWDKMHYMKRMSMAKWGRGLILGECTESSVKHSDRAFSSRTWGAELLMHSYAEPLRDIPNSTYYEADFHGRAPASLKER